MDDALELFIIESQELLQLMEDSLVNIQGSPDYIELVNDIFRSAHTIKGSAGLFGLDYIVGFTHTVESTLDRVRNNQINLDEELINILLSSKDFIGDLVESITDGKENIDETKVSRERVLLEKLSQYIITENHERDQQDASNTAMSDAGAKEDDESKSNDSTLGNNNWHISVHFGKEVLKNGMDPISFLYYLDMIGKIEHLQILYPDLPELEHFNPEECFLGFEINYNCKESKAEIESAFEFVKEDCQLKIIPPKGRINDFLEIIETSISDNLMVGEILVNCGTLTQYELERVLSIQKDSSDKKLLVGEIVVSERLADEKVVQAAVDKQSQIKVEKSKKSQTIRVDAEKLDSLINLIGELVIAGSGVETKIKNMDFSDLHESTLEMTRLIEEVRNSALNLRMVQIGETFNRFNRVVRDVSQELGKDIDLIISGAETELDKTVIEKIGDPLMHLVRNSIDHGIESKEIRLEKGKPEKGKVKLNAYHESGSVVIEIADDGGGLNRERILNKAIQNELVSQSDQLTDQQVYQLIFEAGFSTAEKVSNLSGRGVGMDVVRKNIESLRGTIELSSEEGKGTTTRIRLPLTLAIIDGFMMGVGKSTYVVPLNVVEECIELPKLKNDSANEDKFINLRGEVLPYINLREHFRTSGDSEKRKNIVVVKYGNLKAGLVVDQLKGELQTVIKPLGAMFNHLKGVSGSTILGSGEVALILEPMALIQMAVTKV